MKRVCVVVLALAVPALVFSADVHGQGIQFSRIAGPGDSAGLPAPLVGASDASLDGGKVAFRGYHAPGFYQTVAFRNVDGSGHTVTVTEPVRFLGDPSSSSTIGSQSFGNGFAAFTVSGTYQGSGMQAVLYTKDGAQGIGDVWQEGGGHERTNFQHVAVDASDNRHESFRNIAYRADDANTGGQGVYLRGGFSGPQTIADATTAMPGHTGNFTYFEQVTVDKGMVAFWGQGDSSGKTGIYTGDGVTLNTVAISHQTMLPHSEWASATYSLGAPVIDNGLVAFAGRIGFEYGAIFTANADGSNVKLAASTGDAALGAETPLYTVASDKLAFDGGAVAFSGYDSSLTQGLYWNVGGLLTKVIDANDLLDGKGISFLEIDAECLDGADLAFRVRFTDNTDAVYLASHSHYDAVEMAAAASLTTAALGGSSALGGVDFDFLNAAEGSLTTTYTAIGDPGFFGPTLQLAAGSTSQFWNFQYVADSIGLTPFESVLLTLNYDPNLITGDLVVWHASEQFSSPQILQLGDLNNLLVGQYALAGPGLLQVRLAHFSGVGIGSSFSEEIEPGNSVPEPGSLALWCLVAAGIGVRVTKRRGESIRFSPAKAGQLRG